MDYIKAITTIFFSFAYFDRNERPEKDKNIIQAYSTSLHNLKMNEYFSVFNLNSRLGTSNETFKLFQGKLNFINYSFKRYYSI